VFLVDAAQVQHVPGCKPDRAEARWLAKRTRQGLRQGRLIPPVGAAGCDARPHEVGAGAESRGQPGARRPAAGQ
jgi:hypothetical protein